MIRSGGLLASFLLVLSALYVSKASDSELQPKALEPIQVVIQNRLGTDLQILVHCKSKNDDLGEHIVYNWADYRFNFRVNFWERTLFFCYLSRQGGAATYIDAYTKERDADRCRSKCLWRASPDGVWGYNLGRKIWEKMYQWKSFLKSGPLDFQG